MIEQQINWLEQEEKDIPQNYTGERLESLKLETATITSVVIEFNQPFPKWEDTKNGTIKAIIPVLHNGIRKNWWLNIRNPLYKDIIHRARNGQTLFKIATTGVQKDTKYNIVEEK
jgi:hypothetical protein